MKVTRAQAFEILEIQVRVITAVKPRQCIHTCQLACDGNVVAAFGTPTPSFGHVLQATDDEGEIKRAFKKLALKW